MKKITISAAITSASGGRVWVSLADDYGFYLEYIIRDDDPQHRNVTRTIDIHAGDYSIKIYGNTAGTCTLTVTGEAGTTVTPAINEKRKGPTIFIAKEFTVA